MNDPRSPSLDETVTPGPHARSGSRSRTRGVPAKDAARRAASRAEPRPHSCPEDPEQEGPARPPPSPRFAVRPRSRGLQLTGLRGVAIGRVRLDVDVLHARDAAAQDRAHGVRRTKLGVGRGRRQRRPHSNMARSRPHGRLPTAAEALASEPPPPARPEARRHGGPLPPWLRHIGKCSPLAADGAGRLRAKPAWELHFLRCSSPSEVVD